MCDNPERKNDELIDETLPSAEETEQEVTEGALPESGEEYSYTVPADPDLIPPAEEPKQESPNPFFFDEMPEQEEQTPERTPSGYGGSYYHRPEGFENMGTPVPPQKKNTGLKVFAGIMTVLFLCTAVVFAGYLSYQKGVDNTPPPATEQTKPPVNENAPQLQQNTTPEKTPDIYSDGGLSTEAIAEKVRPSVVGIANYTKESVTASGAGSGIIMTEDGYIITNCHVVENAFALVVTLEDGTEYSAQLIGMDSKTDLAVIKVDAENLPAAEFGDSDALVVGERIVAIGNPTGLNLAGSTTQGIVSGLQRTITINNEETNTAVTMEVIQVDAAINPGNSGGALVNKYGQVVGINTAKITSTNVEGIGFSIPINSAKPVVDDLLKYGYVTGRPLLGITYVAISDEVAEIYHYIPGLQVYTVSEAMDVYAKGLREGDVITQMDGVDVRSSSDVQEIMSKKAPGDTLKLKVIRVKEDGSTETFEIEPVLSEDTGVLPENQPDEDEEEDDRFSDIPGFPGP